MALNDSPRRTLLALAIVALTVTSGCVGSVGSLDSGITADQVSDHVQTKYEQIDSYEATVETTIVGPNTSRTTRTDVVAKPQLGFQRSEYLGPDSMAGNVIVSNATTTWTYNATENSARRLDTSGLGQSMQPDYGQLVESYQDRYDVTVDGTTTVADRETYVVHLTPKNASQFASEMTLWVDTERWFPVQQRSSYTIDNETTTVTTTYHDLRFNTGVSNGTFDYTPPADATIETTTMPSVQRFDSRSALADNTSVAVPDPTVPNDFALERATVTEYNGTTSVRLQYTNDSSTLSVSATREADSATDANGTADSDTETVEIGDATASYQSFGSTGILSWHCGDTRYSVSGDLSKDELIETARSVGCSE